MRAGAALAAGAAIAAALVACSTRAPGPQTSTSIPVLDDQGQREEITALSTQIRQWRLDAHLGVEPAADVIAAMSERSVADAAATCATPTPTAGTCRDVCFELDIPCRSLDTGRTIL